MATNVTSARPIISAAAVVAVRAGLRIALSRASRPAAPPRRAAGRPTPTRAAGRAAARQRHADEQRSAPSADREQRAARCRAVREQAVAEQRQRAPTTPSDDRADGGDCGPRRQRAPSRTAAIGGTRVARIAGHEPGEHRHDDPDEQRDDHRARREHGAACGRSSPSAAEQRAEALARGRSRAQRPIERGEQADRGASSSTERSTCRRDAPSVRSVANSRVRWATVIESVLKMTNAPTNSAIAAEREQEAAG